MSEKHSVEGHLRLDSKEYYRLIRTFIPSYETMLERTVEWLRALRPAHCHVLDLGGGTGALSEAVLKGLPESSVELWDIDPKMLDLAGSRLRRFGSRVTLREKSFFDPIPECDAVVASLSLHHIPERAQKQKVYENLRAGLKPGGVFLNADMVVGESPAVKEQTYARWACFMESQGISREQAYDHFSAWAKDDFYRSLYEEFSLLSAAGFSEPECFWRGDAVAVFGAVK